MRETTEREDKQEKQVVGDSNHFDSRQNHVLQEASIPSIKVEMDDSDMGYSDDDALVIDIPNVKTEIIDDDYVENPQIKFSVKVEVEEYDEVQDIKTEIDEPETNEAQYSNAQNSDARIPKSQDSATQKAVIENSAAQSSCDSIAQNSSAAENDLQNFQVNEQLQDIKPKLHCNAIPIDLDQMYAEVDQIANASTNISDKILARELKNNWGHVLCFHPDVDPINVKIQEVLHQWKIWTSGSRYRDVPMFYKCYICENAWCHLEPFRNHLKVHDVNSYKLDLEEHMHELNVIVYETDTVPPLKIFKMEGECWKCNSAFEDHVSRKPNCAYICEFCQEMSFTCYDMKAHKGVCWQYLKHMQVGKDHPMSICTLCRCIFHSKDELDKHLTTRHDVRSDLPVQTQYKICTSCNMRYFIYGLHYCSKKMLNYNCQKCKREYVNKLMVDLHTSVTEKFVKCQICSVTMEKKCMELIHYQKHTDKFRTGFKCATCQIMEVYLDEESMKFHRFYVHHQKYDRRRNHFHKVLLPSSYFPPVPVDKTPQPTEEIDYPVFEAREVRKTYQGKKVSSDNPPVETSPEEQLRMALKEIKKEIDDVDEPPLNVHKPIFEAFEAVAPTRIESHVVGGVETFVFHEEVGSEPLQIIKTEVKSEPIEQYTDEIIHFTIDLPTDMEIKQEPETTTEPPEQTIDDKEKPQRGRIRKSKVHGKYKYPCSQCSRNFPTARTYILHFTIHGINYLCCPICLKSFKSSTTLVPHVTNHVQQSFLKIRVIDGKPQGKNKNKCRYQCKTCQCKVEYEGLYGHWDTHYETLRRGELSDVCNTPLRSEGLKLIVDALLVQKKELVSKECVLCHRYFKRKNDCRRHLIGHLLADAFFNKPAYGTLKCQICHVGFEKQDQYKLHMRGHGSLPVYQCEICDRAFSDSSNFTKHKKVHNLQVVVCDVCSKKFRSKTTLAKHLEIHRDTMPIVCELCDRTLYTESAYKRHYRRAHDKVYLKVKCQFCGKRFERLKDKWEHLWIVHKERKYKADCTICKKGFRRYIDVKSHMVREHAVLPPRKIMHSVEDENSAAEFDSDQIVEFM